MKKSLLVLAVSALFSAVAVAGNDNGPTTNNNQTYNQQTYNQPQGGTGVGVGVGVGIGQGGSATGGAATVGDIRNTNTAAGGSVLGSGNSTATGGTVRDSGNSSAGAAVIGSGNSDSKSQVLGSGNADVRTTSTTAVNIGGDTYAAPDLPVSTAYAPNVMPTAVCALSASGGLTVANFSLSGGGTWIDDNCVLLEQVRRANEIGQREVAAEMMMDVPAFAKAAKRLSDRKAAQAAANPVPVAKAPTPAPVAVVAKVEPAKAVVTGTPTDGRRFTAAEEAFAKRQLGLPQ